MKSALKLLFIGIGATLTIDIWTSFLCHIGISTQGTLFVGRWIAYMPSGQFMHDSIIHTPPSANERIIGLIAHYCIGIAFTFLLRILNRRWLEAPDLQSAVLYGLMTLLPALLIVQPALGFGIAFTDTPNPLFLLFKIITIHVAFGIGLYLCAKIVQYKLPAATF